MKEIILVQNPWWTSNKVPEEWIGKFEREMFSELTGEIGNKKITSIVGPRRAGKTTLLYQLVQHLLENKTENNRIVYVQFETKKLCKEGIFMEILDMVSERLNEPYMKFSKKVFLFLDEVHHVQTWAEEIKQLQDLKLNLKIFISGSSSLRILKGSGESLLGRINHHILLPLSFREVAKNKLGINISKQDMLNLEHSHLKNIESQILTKMPELKLLFKDYIHKGGYPEISAEDGTEKAFRILTDYKDLALQRDLFEQEEIRDVKSIRELLEFLGSVVSNRINYSNVASNLGIKQDTAKKYIGLLEDIFLVKESKVFSKKPHISTRKERKVFFIDSGMLNAINLKYEINEDYEPRLVENCVFDKILEMLYALSISPNMFYWVDEYDNEVDFVVSVGDKTLPIEVKYRENPNDVKSFLKFCDKFKVKKGIVITKDLLSREKIDGKEILFVPARLFLLAV